MWENVKQILSLHSDFILTTHKNPDADGVGSASALIELLISLGKRVRFVCDSDIPRWYSFLDYHKRFEKYSPKEEYEECKVLVVLDAHQKERIGRLSQISAKNGVITLCIDHHPLSELFTPYSFIDEHACSVGEMVYNLYKEWGIPLTKRAATGIYASVLCDTGRFSYSCTNQRAHHIAEECMELGVDPDFLYKQLYQHISLKQFKMMAAALQHMETYCNNRVVLQEIRREDYEKLGEEVKDIENIDLEFILELNKLIEEVECVILLRELSDGWVRVSVRSKFSIDMTPLMKALGGGGHAKAAGVLCRGSLQEIKEKLLLHLGSIFSQDSIVK